MCLGIGAMYASRLSIAPLSMTDPLEFLGAWQYCADSMLSVKMGVDVQSVLEVSLY
jgi:hypothetical protein